MARPILILVALLVGLAVAPQRSSAGTYNIRFCPTSSDSGPTGPEWSTDTAGVSPSGHSPAGATLRCLDFPNSRTSITGVGGWLGVALPGATATVRFTPPIGTRIVALRATRQVEILAGSYAEAGVYTSAGRALDDTGPQRSGAALGRVAEPVEYSAPQLQADGATGLEWGVRCPAVLPPGVTQCGGGTYGLVDGTISLADDSAPALEISPSNGDDAAVAWTATDSQSGVQAVVVDVDGTRGADAAQACSDLSVRPCPITVSSSTRVALDAGEHRTVTVKATNAAGDTTVASAVLTRAPRSVPGAEAASVTFTVRARARGLVLSGRAQGCSAVVVRIPRRRGAVVVRVREGTWTLSVRKRAGAYSVRCGSATATRKVKRTA